VDRDPIRGYGPDTAVVVATRAGRPPLDAVLAALPTPSPARVVVVDTAADGPEPAAPDGVQLLRLAEDVGRAAAVNRAVAGLDAAVGWIVLTEPRVRWRPGALDAMRATAARHPRAALLGPGMRGGDGRLAPSGGPLPLPSAAVRGRARGAPPAGPTGWLSSAAVLVRRTAWDSVDGFDSRYLGGPGDMGDVDLGDRLGRAGWLAVHVPDAEVAVGPDDGHGILEPHTDGVRRYVRDRGRMTVRALMALAHRARRVRSS
jgi:N-acetylglucosaminyl-diphospho-decaprenol L-rhamnosyltransferase